MLQTTKKKQMKSTSFQYVHANLNRTNERTKKGSSGREKQQQRSERKKRGTIPNVIQKTNINDDAEQKRNINSGSNTSGKTEQIANYLVRRWCCCVGANRNVHASVHVWVAWVCARARPNIALSCSPGLVCVCEVTRITLCVSFLNALVKRSTIIYCVHESRSSNRSPPPPPTPPRLSSSSSLP